MRRLDGLFWFVWILFLIGIAGKAHGQCCASGNPFISDAEQPALQSKVLTAALTYRYSHAEQFYHKDSPYTDLPFSQTSTVNFTELRVAYGVTNWLTITGDLGYFFNKTLQTDDQEPMTGHGLGDAALYFKFNALSIPKARLNISPTLGMKFPVGVFDQETDHVQLPISVQPSSGSYKYLANVFVSKGIAPKISLAAFIAYEYSQRIQSENFDYQYGEQWIAAIYCNYKMFKRLDIDLQIRNEYRAKSVRENSEVVESTGYDVIFFTPQVTYSIPGYWFISAFGDIPLYKYYNGIQMSFGYAISLRLTKKIDFITMQSRRKAHKPTN